MPASWMATRSEITLRNRVHLLYPDKPHEHVNNQKAGVSQLEEWAEKGPHEEIDEFGPFQSS